MKTWITQLSKIGIQHTRNTIFEPSQQVKIPQTQIEIPSMRQIGQIDKSKSFTNLQPQSFLCLHELLNPVIPEIKVPNIKDSTQSPIFLNSPFCKFDVFRQSCRQAKILSPQYWGLYPLRQITFSCQILFQIFQSFFPSKDCILTISRHGTLLVCITITIIFLLHFRVAVFHAKKQTFPSSTDTNQRGSKSTLFPFLKCLN